MDHDKHPKKKSKTQVPFTKSSPTTPSEHQQNHWMPPNQGRRLSGRLPDHQIQLEKAPETWEKSHSDQMTLQQRSSSHPSHIDLSLRWWSRMALIGRASPSHFLLYVQPMDLRRCSSHNPFLSLAALHPSRCRISKRENHWSGIDFVRPIC